MLTPLMILSLDQGRLYRADPPVPEPESAMAAMPASVAVEAPTLRNRVAVLASRLAFIRPGRPGFAAR